MIFPLWLLWIIPSTWIVILPANFLIDLAVLLITMHCLKISGRKEIIKRSVWKIWVFGFISDFIGTFFMFLVNIIDSFLDYRSPLTEWWYNNLTNAVTYNPLSTPAAFLWTILCILISGSCIFLFNYHFCLRKAVPDQILRKKLALSLAIFTAPYLFLVPTSWFFM
ncbi:hypothetical protein BEI59_15660 [Eisenbergiella tayi]|uniref:Uncharacterized protein n=2 Tax=Eisenbergiella tayi TaxID=1432052 RepID=A0A1E3UGW5_9FIRM|nr:hypothetical protein BEI59_15660 [Eisenbergiella tayi]ODR56439.1 hypothetical protein BEI64_21200 [Eisenbergiella tayi]ODR57119.1 hypothetical protein BEI63_12500 [Eisenbergiella tayi]